jgi:hypothetical protein
MNKQLWIPNICDGIRAVLGVAIAESIAPVFAIKPIIVTCCALASAGRRHPDETTLARRIRRVFEGLLPC